MSSRRWVCRRCLNIRGHRWLSSSSNLWQWRKLGNLGVATVESFQQQCLLPAEPAILKGAFREIPAAVRWFSREGPTSSLRKEYLQPYESTPVPMELTRKVGQKFTFQRATAPLSMLFSWDSVSRQSHPEDSCSLYVAQAPLTSLPDGLQKDLPTPTIVFKAGKGDVYDANLWMGFSPTYTPLHKDPNPNLFVQLAGCKTVRLMAPEKGEAVFSKVQQTLGRHGSASFRGDEMMQGQERDLLEKLVWEDSNGDEMLDAEAGLEVELEGGDGVFIPNSWWHSIKGTGTGITASVNWWFR